MAEVGTAFVTIVPSARGFGSALNAQTGPASAAAGKAGGGKFGGTFMGGAKSALKGFAGIFAVGVVVKGLRDVVGEAREAQKVGAITAQTIKTTGGVANITAGQVSKLATAISNKTGIDDEAIQTGSNLLLTFKNVRNEAGKGADIFNQATQAAVDLSAHGFGSIDSASKMLGKALNDPVKGMTALGRAGVTFSESQKKAIQKMVESGDVLGAQKIILGEVKSQVGGTAAASATAGEKMKTAWNNAKESLGTALLPAIDKLQIAITTKIIPAIVKFIGFLQKNPAIVKAFAIAIAAIAAAFVIAFIAANAIVIGIGLLVAGLVYAYTQSETFRKIVDAVFKALKAVIVGILKFIVGYIKTSIAIIVATWKFIKAIPGFVKSAFNFVKNIISTAIRFVVDKVSAGVKNVITFFKELPGKIVDKLKSLATKLKNLAKDAMTGLWNGLKAGAQKVYDKAKEIANKIKDTIKSALHITSPSKVMIEVGKNITEGIAIGITARGPQVTSAMGGIAERVTLPSSGIASPRMGAVAPASSSGTVDRPILTETGTLLGWIKTLANGEARLVWAQQDHAGALRTRFS